MGRKKPFIKPNEGVKFYLVNRSQKDPLYLDETLGEHVLVPVDPDVRKDLVNAVNGINLNTNKKSESEKEELKRKRLEEQQKFGIYFEDNYNYLQHLREIDQIYEEQAELEKPDMLKIGSVLIKNDDDDDETSNIERKKLQLPSTVFASQFEEEVGYFNQAAPDHDPKIHWDPDVVRILDEDPDIDFEDEENFLDDDFFKKANDPEPRREKGLKDKSLNVDEEYEDSGEDFDSDEAENNDFFDDYSESQSVRDFETKSRFTEYSMTSSVVKRNEKLRVLGEFRFRLTNFSLILMVRRK